MCRFQAARASAARFARAVIRRPGGSVLGLEGYDGAPESIFDAPDGLCGDFSVAREEPDLDAVRASRKDKSEKYLRQGRSARLRHGGRRVHRAPRRLRRGRTGAGGVRPARHPLHRLGLPRQRHRHGQGPHQAPRRALRHHREMACAEVHGGRDRRHRRRNGAALRRQAQRQRLVHRRDDRTHARRGRCCADRVPALRRAGRHRAVHPRPGAAGRHSRRQGAARHRDHSQDRLLRLRQQVSGGSR